ncbi:MAG: hypothetical protein LBG59_07445 [Candidatus Peribacteria bacterium]|jgi:hypothetical protein|nr:hypothetical protein [Candidatus Peribacteria bacterium]
MTEGNGRDITPFQPSVNVQQLQEILKLLDDYAIILTGLNFKAPYTSPAKTAFETSVMKEEQNNRFKVPLTLRNEGLGLVFGTMLCNIFQYVPYLYSKRLRDEELGKSTLEDKWYQIPITGKKIIRKKEKDSQTATGGQRTIDDILELEDAEGYEDYFEMAP